MYIEINDFFLFKKKVDLYLKFVNRFVLSCHMLVQNVSTGHEVIYQWITL